MGDKALFNEAARVMGTLFLVVFLLITATMVLALLPPSPTPLHIILEAAEFEDQQREECMTDSECMDLCPPPMDDPDCDGGPEPTWR